MTYPESPTNSSNHEISEFSKTLRVLTAGATDIRPLLCAGNPLTCSVAIVGINPAAKTPFWPYWSEKTGMDRGSWLQEYKALHDGKVSRSRAALERFIPQVTAGRVIELNAHAKQSRRLVDLPSAHRTTDVLEFVLSKVRPTLILCAGVSAFDSVQRLSLSLTWKPNIVEARHFIYWGVKYESELAGKLNRIA
jgi:hypothetical protein